MSTVGRKEGAWAARGRHWRPKEDTSSSPLYYRRFCLLRRPFVTYRSMYVANDNVAEVGSQRFGNAACVLSAMV